MQTLNLAKLCDMDMRRCPLFFKVEVAIELSIQIKISDLFSTQGTHILVM